MKQLLITVLLVLVFTSCTNSTKQRDESKPEKLTIESSEQKSDAVPIELNIPRMLPDFVKSVKLPDSLKLGTDNGFYGDFNGDDKDDFAYPVTNLKSGFYGLVIIHNDATPNYSVIGMNPKIGKLCNLDWIDPLLIIPKGQYIAPTFVHKKTGDIIGPNRKKVFKLIGDGISMMVKESRGGGILFWNGKEYDWYHIE